MAQVILFEEFIEITANSVITVPFVIDDLQKVRISIVEGICDKNSEIQNRIETENGEVVTPDAIEYSNYVLHNPAPGNYKIIVSVGNIAFPFDHKLSIKSEDNLQMETIVIPSTLNAAKPGLIQTRLFYQDYSNPVENAIVSIGTHNLEYQGNGVYATTFPPDVTTESVLLSLYARGSYRGIPFQRHFTQVIQALSGEVVFTGPYSWEVIRDSLNPSLIHSITLKFGIEVKQSGRYLFSASLTTITDKKRALPEQDWLSDSARNRPYRAGSGDEWTLESGIHILELEFSLEDILRCGDGPYRIFHFIACPADKEDNLCDEIIDPTGFPLLVLNDQEE